MWRHHPSDPPYWTTWQWRHHPCDPPCWTTWMWRHHPCDPPSWITSKHQPKGNDMWNFFIVFTLLKWWIFSLFVVEWIVSTGTIVCHVIISKMMFTVYCTVRVMEGKVTEEHRGNITGSVWHLVLSVVTERLHTVCPRVVFGILGGPTGRDDLFRGDMTCHGSRCWSKEIQKCSSTRHSLWFQSSQLGLVTFTSLQVWYFKHVMGPICSHGSGITWQRYIHSTTCPSR